MSDSDAPKIEQADPANFRTLTAMSDCLFVGAGAGVNALAGDNCIIIGKRAAPDFQRGRCCVALGDDVQLPDGSEHVLAIAGQAPQRLLVLTDDIAALIRTELRRQIDDMDDMDGPAPPLPGGWREVGDQYIEQFRRNCGTH
jgi:3',5'-cyclic AMP phosphodiesterase CpdA